MPTFRYQQILIPLLLFSVGLRETGLNDDLPHTPPTSITLLTASGFDCEAFHSQLYSPKRCSRGHLLYLCSLVIQNAHDCHPNPGPRPPKFPCQECGKACKWSKTIRSVACSNCEKWFHTDCLHMNTAVYETLEASDMLAGIVVTVAYLTSTQACSKTIFHHPLTACTLLDLPYHLMVLSSTHPTSDYQDLHRHPLLGSASPFLRGNYA